MINVDNNQNTHNWKGILYFNRKDTRIFVPKREPGLGWTLNFAKPLSYIVLLALVGLILVISYFTQH